MCSSVSFCKHLGILLDRTINESLTVELLECVRNLIANNDANKCILTSRKCAVADITILELMSGLCMSDKASETVFALFCDVLQMLAVHKDTRPHLLKTGVLTAFVKNLGTKVKPARVSLIVDVLISYTQCIDGQVTLIQEFELLETLSDLIHRYPSESYLVFLLMRNLSVPRENKVRFVSNGIFV
jgi:hypothetical protein